MQEYIVKSGFFLHYKQQTLVNAHACACIEHRQRERYEGWGEEAEFKFMYAFHLLGDITIVSMATSETH